VACFTLAADQLHFRHAISPYVGEQLQGVVQATYLRGQAVYQDGGFAASPTGREVTLF
jgi:allantoinase